MNGNFFGGGSGCDCMLWILILLCCCGGCGGGCNDDYRYSGAQEKIAKAVFDARYAKRVMRFDFE